ncbi:MAG: hypothetical protein Q7S68_05960 [Deltaproteobacteria bacterium]|nr:hypothetical protein [Deltaproteobacteria bacterium]
MISAGDNASRIAAAKAQNCHATGIARDKSKTKCDAGIEKAFNDGDSHQSVEQVIAGSVTICGTDKWDKVIGASGNVDKTYANRCAAAIFQNPQSYLQGRSVQLSFEGSASETRTIELSGVQIAGFAISPTTTVKAAFDAGRSAVAQTARDAAARQRQGQDAQTQQRLEAAERLAREAQARAAAAEAQAQSLASVVRDAQQQQAIQQTLAAAADARRAADEARDARGASNVAAAETARDNAVRAAEEAARLIAKIQQAQQPQPVVGTGAGQGAVAGAAGGAQQRGPIAAQPQSKTANKADKAEEAKESEKESEETEAGELSFSASMKEIQTKFAPEPDAPKKASPIHGKIKASADLGEQGFDNLDWFLDASLNGSLYDGSKFSLGAGGGVKAGRGYTLAIEDPHTAFGSDNVSSGLKAKAFAQLEGKLLVGGEKGVDLSGVSANLLKTNEYASDELPKIYADRWDRELSDEEKKDGKDRVIASQLFYWMIAVPHLARTTDADTFTETFKSVKVRAEGFELFLKSDVSVLADPANGWASWLAFTFQYHPEGLVHLLALYADQSPAEIEEALTKQKFDLGRLEIKKEGEEGEAELAVVYADLLMAAKWAHLERTFEFPNHYESTLDPSKLDVPTSRVLKPGYAKAFEKALAQIKSAAPEMADEIDAVEDPGNVWAAQQLLNELMASVNESTEEPMFTLVSRVGQLRDRVVANALGLTLGIEAAPATDLELGAYINVGAEGSKWFPAEGQESALASGGVAWALHLEAGYVLLGSSEDPNYLKLTGAFTHVGAGDSETNIEIVEAGLEAPFVLGIPFIAEGSLEVDISDSASTSDATAKIYGAGLTAQPFESWHLKGALKYTDGFSRDGSRTVQFDPADRGLDFDESGEELLDLYLSDSLLEGSVDLIYQMSGGAKLSAGYKRYVLSGDGSGSRDAFHLLLETKF